MNKMFDHTRMKFTQFSLLVSLVLPTTALAQSFAVRTQEVWNFKNNIATAKVGKVIECYGDWDLQDPPNVVDIRCESLGLPAHHPANFESINRYLHNGWEMVDRQVLPHFLPGSRQESRGFKRVTVRLKKVEPRKQFVDPLHGPLESVVRP